MFEKDKQLEIHQDVLCICRRPSAVRVEQLKCQREGCNLWLHQQCYRRRYCPYCCLEMLNPFCVPSFILVTPTVLIESDKKLVGRGKFRLTPTQQQMVVLPENQIQMWCMRVDDDQSSTQWPLNSFLMVNENPLAMEPALSTSTHDHCVTILDIQKQGTNSVLLMGDPDPKSGSDFCFGVRIGKQLSVEMVSQNIVAVSFGGTLDRCMKILTTGPGADMIQLHKLSLLCPLSQSKVKCPARFRGCQHMSSFDLISFLEYTRSDKKWCCPICNRKYPSFALVLDGFLMPIVSALPENVKEIEVQADASWKVEGGANWTQPQSAYAIAQEEAVGPEIVPISSSTSSSSSSDEENVDVVVSADPLIDEENVDVVVSADHPLADEENVDVVVSADPLALGLLSQYGTDSE